jgi:hypothetical protein
VTGKTTIGNIIGIIDWQTHLSGANFFQILQNLKLQASFYAQLSRFEGRIAQISGKNQFSLGRRELFTW